ncbi:MAG: hypothetical protein ACUVQR_08535 [Thermogutta sp.]
MGRAKHSSWITRAIGAIVGIAIPAVSMHVFAAPPAVTVRLAPVVQWQENALFLADMLKEKAVSNQFRAAAGVLEALTKNGLDAKRPIGVLCLAGENGQPVVTVCIPVTDLDQLYALARDWVKEPIEISENLYRVTVRNRDLTVKTQGDWLLLSRNPRDFDLITDDPTRFFEGLSESAEISISINPQQLIRLDRKAIKEWVKRQERVAGIISKVARSPEIREAIINPIVETAAEASRQTDKVTMYCQIDRSNKKLVGGCTWTAKPGSDLAAYFAQQRSVTSPLVAIRRWNDAAFMMGWSATFPPPSEENLRNLGSLIEGAWHHQIERRISNQSAADTAKALADDLLSILGDWIREGKMDGVISLVSRPDQITLLAGGYVANSTGLENWAGNLVESARQHAPGAFDRITVVPDHTLHGDASIHLMQISLKDRLSPEQVAVLGEDLEIAFTATNGYAAVAIGKNAIGVIKRAIDDAVAAGEQSAPAYECAIKLDDLVAALASVMPQDRRLQQLKSNLEQCEGVQSLSKKVEFTGQAMAVTFEVDLNLLKLPNQ